ncbi:MAG: hypothetical protein P1V13_22350 [Rhizobiaceae bacterium]|nr:hypothetical protein [Rhizobiaceae bacterium]
MTQVHSSNAGGCRVTYFDRMRQIADEIFAERLHQVSGELFTPEDEDRYMPGTCALAAVTYALPKEVANARLSAGQLLWRALWPWSIDLLRLTDRRSNLVRSAALILAEIEHLDRAARRAQGDGGDDA